MFRSRNDYVSPFIISSKYPYARSFNTLIKLFIHPYTHLPIHLPIHPSICPSICPSVRPSIYPQSSTHV